VWLEDLDSRTPTPESLYSDSEVPPSADSPNVSTSSESDDDSIPSIMHAVIFKCIGVHKERRYQDVLSEASRKLDDGDDMPVKLYPKSENQRLLLLCAKLLAQLGKGLDMLCQKC